MTLLPSSTFQINSNTVSFSMTADNLSIAILNQATETKYICSIPSSIPDKYLCISDNLLDLYNFITDACKDNSASVNNKGFLVIPYEINIKNKLLKSQLIAETIEIKENEFNDLKKTVKCLEVNKRQNQKTIQQLKAQLSYQRKLIANLQNKLTVFNFQPGVVQKLQFPENDSKFELNYKVRANYLCRKQNNSRSRNSYGIQQSIPEIAKSIKAINLNSQSVFSFQIIIIESFNKLVFGLIKQNSQPDQSFTKEIKAIITQSPKQYSVFSTGKFVQNKNRTVITMTINNQLKHVTWFVNSESVKRQKLQNQESTKLYPFVYLNSLAQIIF